MEFDVTIDRASFIGGSDIPAIMGISPFKTRYELLLEKAGLKENEFTGNRYTVYGQQIEPKIRAYINQKYNTTFEPNQVINGDFRGHTDGFNGSCVLEIKSTSQIHETVWEYEVYLVQLVKYMDENHVTAGILAVYDRPEDFDTEFDPDRLQIFDINLADFQILLDRVNIELDRFRVDLERLKENPLLTEEDFQPAEVVAIANQVVEFEQRLAELKAVENRCKEMKQQLFEAMEMYSVKSWELYNGTKITRVDGTSPTVETVEEFDIEAFKAQHPELYQQFSRTVEKQKNGRAGYVKITLKR